MTLLAPPHSSSRVTPDDLLKMNGLFELVDGQLSEKQMSFLSGKTVTNLSSILIPFIKSQKLGELASEVTFRCFPNDPDQVRRPDLAFISAARLNRVPDEGHIPIAPDLAIEIVSPNDSVYELDDKLIDYRAAGIPLIWIINPHAKGIRIFRPGKPIEELGAGDQLTGDTILPGFSAGDRYLSTALIWCLKRDTEATSAI